MCDFVSIFVIYVKYCSESRESSDLPRAVGDHHEQGLKSERVWRIIRGNLMFFIHTECGELIDMVLCFCGVDRFRYSVQGDCEADGQEGGGCECHSLRVFMVCCEKHFVDDKLNLIFNAGNLCKIMKSYSFEPGRFIPASVERIGFGKLLAFDLHTISAKNSED